MSDGTVRVINEDRAGRIWLGTEKGVTIIHPDGHIEIIRHDPFSHNSLSDNAIYAIINDINNNIWIGSYFGGVDVLFNNNATFTCFEPGYSPQNIKGKVPRTMTETEKGVYWIATEDNGINIYDSVTGTFRLFDRIPGLGTNIHSLLYDSRKKDMWIGTFRNGLFRYKHQDRQNGRNTNATKALTQVPFSQSSDNATAGYGSPPHWDCVIMMRVPTASNGSDTMSSGKYSYTQ